MKNLAAGFVLAFSFVAVRPAAAQEDVKRGSWQSVLALAPGAKVHVRRIDGAEQSGVIQKVSGDGIELTTKSAVVSMLRADVRAVEVPRKVRRRGRNLAIAAGIGAVPAHWVA